jgi:predicted HicB family RNase H-like nuclease
MKKTFQEAIEMSKITFRLPKELAQRAKIEAVKQDVTLEALIVAALSAHLPKKGSAR